MCELDAIASQSHRILQSCRLIHKMVLAIYSTALLSGQDKASAGSGFAWLQKQSEPGSAIILGHLYAQHLWIYGLQPFWESIQGLTGMSNADARGMMASALQQLHAALPPWISLTSPA